MTWVFAVSLMHLVWAARSSCIRKCVSSTTCARPQVPFRKTFLLPRLSWPRTAAECASPAPGAQTCSFPSSVCLPHGVSPRSARSRACASALSTLRPSPRSEELKFQRFYLRLPTWIPLWARMPGSVLRPRRGLLRLRLERLLSALRLRIPTFTSLHVTFTSR